METLFPAYRLSDQARLLSKNFQLKFYNRGQTLNFSCYVGFSLKLTIASIAAFGAASEASVLNTSSPAKADETNNAHEAALAAKMDLYGTF